MEENTCLTNLAGELQAAVATDDTNVNKEKDVVIGVEENSLVANSITEVHEIIKQHEIENTLKFSIYTSCAGFGNADVFKKKHKVYWSDTHIHFFGMPYFILSTKVLDCQHGKKRRHKQEKVGNCKRKYITTKKVGCGAQIKLKEIILFPQFKIDENTKWKKNDMSRKVRLAFEGGNITNMITKFIITLPDLSSHVNHELGEAAGVSQSIDSLVIKRIHELVFAGVTSVSEMRLHLDAFVQNELFYGKDLPPKSNKRFYPEEKNIRSQIYTARQKYGYLPLKDGNNYEDTYETTVGEYNILDHGETCYTENVEEEVHEPVLKKQAVQNSYGPASREILDELKGLSYLTEGNIVVMKKFLKSLEDMKSLLSNTVQKSCGLTVEYKTEEKKKRCRQK
ncbi:uncharacterized protein LOC130655006 isoform X2 [Hydractinia symbiolongicarpus]|uniref:uncharacterized protein LOC130655006 isoform X2 n=1 Tax=Hydractinia symbiolongicarpus TaxID=13093 RepID=UPI00254D147C|nr:uncharacterized protein LOC130655006 isoform X2 [Hydractinia symbiolongicarpus]